MLKFKDGQEFESVNVTEQRLFQDSTPCGWLLAITLTGNITSEVVDEILTEENISEITYGDVTITGYQSVNSTVLYYAEDGVRADIQLSKGV